MSTLRVASFTISPDGFGAGPNQDINNPLGVGGTSLHGWVSSTRTFPKAVIGKAQADARRVPPAAIQDFHFRRVRLTGRLTLALRIRGEFQRQAARRMLEATSASGTCERPELSWGAGDSSITTCDRDSPMGIGLRPRCRRNTK